MAIPMASATDYFTAEQTSLRGGSDSLDQYITMARASLQELVDQRGILKAC